MSEQQVSSGSEHGASEGAGPGGGPVACSLSPAGLADRTVRWQRLMTQALTGRAEAADGLRLSFRPGPGVEAELRELVVAERECCGWARWAVQTAAGRVVLTIRADSAGITALHGMFTGPAGQERATVKY